MRARQGFSLLETAIVLAVAGLVLGGLWIAIGTVRDRSRLSQVVTDTAYVVQGVKDFYRNSPAVADMSNVSGAGDNGATDAGHLTSYIIERGLIPPEMVRNRSASSGYLADHAAVSSDWLSSNGTVGSFAVRSDEGDASYQFLVDIKGLSQSACIVLAAKLTAGEQGMPSPLKTKVASTTYDGPVNPEDANNSCQTGTSNTITMTFRLRDNM